MPGHPRGGVSQETAKNLKKATSSTGERLKVVEEEGAPEIATVRRTNPFREQSCRFKDSKCIVEGGKYCGAMGCIYEITCTSCQEPVDLGQGEKETRTQGARVKSTM